MMIQSEIVAQANLKTLAEWCRKINGDAWFAEESYALASIPTFSAEAFIAAASPAAVLALVHKSEKLQQACADAIKFVAFAFDQGIEGAEAAGVAMEQALEAVGRA